MSARILAEKHREVHLASGLLPDRSFENFADGYGAGLLVRYFDAYDALAGNRRLDSDAGCPELHLDGLRHRRDLLGANAGGGQKFEDGHHRSAGDVRDLDVELELLEGVDQDLLFLLGVAVVSLAGSDRGKDLHRRHLVWTHLFFRLACVCGLVCGRLIQFGGGGARLGIGLQFRSALAL